MEINININRSIKKITFFAALVFLITLTSCSSDNETNSNIAISPPSWIQGAWMEEGQSAGFKFTSNDLIVILPGGVQQSQRELLLLGSNSGQSVSATDQIRSDYYSVTLKYPPGQSVTYTFTKLTNSSIAWTAAPDSVLYKQ